MTKKKSEVTIRSSAAEYLTYVASVGGEDNSMEMRYEEENNLDYAELQAQRHIPMSIYSG